MFRLKLSFSLIALTFSLGFNKILAQVDTKGVIELENGQKIKPEKIESKLYVIIADSLLSQPNALLIESKDSFDNNSRMVYSEQYMNQRTNYRIHSYEYDTRGNILKRIEKEHDDPETTYVFQYEFDSLDNWVLKKEFILYDTLKFKYCTTRKIEYRENQIEKFRNHQVSVLSYHCYGPIKTICENSRSWRLSECGEVNEDRKISKLFFNEDYSVVEIKSYYEGNLNSHWKYSLDGSNELIESILPDRKIITDTLRRINGLELLRKVVLNGKITSEIYYKYNTNGDVIYIKPSDSSKEKKEFQYLKYNEHSEWTQKIEFRDERPYFYTEREITYQLHSEN